MSAHTPGPWTPFRYTEKANSSTGVRSGWYINQVGGPGYVTDIEEYPHRIEECEANARLIAAAPDLLEACLAYLADREEAGCTADSGAVKKMRAAIAKATGDAS